MTRIASTTAIAAVALGGLSQAATIDTWEPVKSQGAIPSTVRQNPSNPDQVWIGYSNGEVYLSSNGRLDAPTWNRLDSASDGHGGVVDAAPGLAVTSIAPMANFDGYTAYVSFAGTQQGGKLWRVDWNRTGLTWTDLTGRLPYGDVWNVSFNPRAGVLYVTTAGGVAYSMDNAQTFTTSAPYNDPYQPPTEGKTSAVAVNPLNETAVVGTTSGEVWLASRITPPWTIAWTKLSSGYWGALPSQLVSSVAVDLRDAGGKTFYASFGGRVEKSAWVTRTGGQFWNPIVAPNIPVYGNGFGSIVANLSVAPAPNATTLYATTEYGPFRSDDNGTTWFASPRWSGKNLAVEHYTFATGDLVNDIRPVIRIRNLGSTDASVAGAKIRYRFTANGTQPLAAAVYSTSWPWSSNVALAPGQAGETVAEYTVSGTQKIAAGATGAEIQSSIHKTDWSSTLNQTDDFSFAPNAAYKLSPWIELWVGGNKVWGAIAK